jgi:hypothetical protein
VDAATIKQHLSIRKAGANNLFQAMKREDLIAYPSRCGWVATPAGVTFFQRHEHELILNSGVNADNGVEASSLEHPSTTKPSSPRQRVLPPDPEFGTLRGALLGFVRISGGHGDAATLMELCRRRFPEIDLASVKDELEVLMIERFIVPRRFEPDQQPFAYWACSIYADPLAEDRQAITV